MIGMTVASGRTTSPVPLEQQLRRLLWSMVHRTVYRFSFHTWSNFRAFLLRLFGARIGKHCTIRRTSRIYYPWLLEMGDLSALGDSVEIYNLGEVTIGSRVTISQEAYLCAGTHDYSRADMPLLTPAITVADDAWICARAFVMPGIVVGAGAILGACAVAIHDLEPWSIYGGNPARKIGERQPIE